MVQSRTGSLSHGSRLNPFPYVRESRTRHCGTGFLRVRVQDLIKFPMGHPCPSLDTLDASQSVAGQLML